MIMHVGRTRRSLINISVSLTNKVIVTILPFIIRTAMIQTIGIEYLGLDSLFSSILNMLNLSELGFNSAIVYCMYKPIAQGDDEKVRALLTFYKKIYKMVGTIILVCGLLILPFLDWFIAEGTTYPPDINIYLVYGVLLFNTSVSYLLFAYKSSILVATMRNDLDSIIDMVRSVLSHVLQIIVLLLFREYYFYILILPLVTITNNIVRSIIIDKRYPQYCGKAELSKEDKHDIFTRVGALVGNQIGGVVFTSVDSLVISKFLGLVVLAQYTNYYTIYAGVYAIVSTIYSSFQSVIGHSLVTNSKETNYLLFKDLFYINAILTCICTGCFVTLYQVFIEFWVGKSNVLGIEVPLLLSLYFFVKSTRRTLVVFKEAAGMWREDFLKPYVSVIVNLVTNIILVRLIGLPGVIFSSIVALIFVEIPWETSVFFRKYFKQNAWLYVMDIFFAAFVCGVATILSYFMCLRFENGFFGIAIRLFVTLVICIGIYAPLIYFLPKYKNVKVRLLNLMKQIGYNKK